MQSDLSHLRADQRDGDNGIAAVWLLTFCAIGKSPAVAAEHVDRYHNSTYDVTGRLQRTRSARAAGSQFE